MAISTKVRDPFKGLRVSSIQLMRLKVSTVPTRSLTARETYFQVIKHYGEFMYEGRIPL